MNDRPAELELRGITKRYPAVVANDDISLTVRRGEIHAIVGENGAGKTTLMSVLYGLTTPDEGEILVRGEPVRFRSAHDAIEAGLGMVHQAFRLFPTMTVAENVVYGHEPRTGWFLDRAAAKRAVNELATGYGLSVDPSARIEDLRVGVLQRVEILKALYRDARVLILDEPTAVLTPQERDSLFEVLRHLRADGRTILFITHKLERGDDAQRPGDRAASRPSRPRGVDLRDLAGRALAGDDRTGGRHDDPPPAGSRGGCHPARGRRRLRGRCRRRASRRSRAVPRGGGGDRRHRRHHGERSVGPRRGDRRVARHRVGHDRPARDRPRACRCARASRRRHRLRPRRSPPCRVGGSSLDP